MEVVVVVIVATAAVVQILVQKILAVCIFSLIR